MIIKKLILKNIRSYEDLEVDFPVGSTLLTGEIGAGKTSVLLGIQFALFGLQPGQKGSSLLRQGEDEAYAKIFFEVDGQTISLERTIKKSKTGSITQEYNVLTMDEQVYELSTLEMKNKVMEILNYPKEFAKKANMLYKYTVYTPQEEMKSIVLERPEIRLDTIRHIFGIDRYKKVQENSKIFLQKIKDTIKIKEVLVGELNLLKEKLQVKAENKIQLSKETNNLEIESNKIKTEKDFLEDQLNDFQLKMDENQRIITENETQKATLEQKIIMKNRFEKEIELMRREIIDPIDYSEEKLNSLNMLITKHKVILDEKTNIYLEINSRIMSLESQKEKPLHMTETIMSMENCPICLQQVSPEHKEKISKKNKYEIEEINRELESKIFNKNQLIKEMNRERDLVADYEKDKNILEQNKIKFEHQKNIETKIKSEIFILERLASEIVELENSINMFQKELDNFQNIKIEYTKVKDKYNELLQKQRAVDIRFAEKNKELQLIKAQLDDLSKEIETKENLRAQIITLRNLQDWIEDKFLPLITITEKNVLAKIRIEFSNILSNWFNILVEQPLFIKLDEDFTPIIINQDYEIDYEFLSGGERTAVALAYRLALNQVLNSILSKIKTTDIVILDEPTDGFASEQIDKMRDIFEQMNAKQLIVVSHEQKIEGFVDHVLKVDKAYSSKVEKVVSGNL